MGIFSDHLRSNIDRVLVEVNYKITYVAYVLFTKIVNNSPHVGDGPYVAGHFVANWWPSVGAYDNSITGAVSNGSDSLARIETLIKPSKAFYQKDGFLSLSNNLNYAFRVEYKEFGWPAGKDPLTGWTWTGLRRAYSPVQNSFTAMKGIL